jgi:hypothetical protein
MTSALASPTHHDLVAVMANQRRLLEQLLFRHAEISMLIAAGEHRFVGRAIDEALEVEAELGAVELLRAMTSSALDSADATLSEIVEGAPQDVAPQLNKLAKDMTRLLTEVERYRRQASAWAGERAGMVSKAVSTFGAQTYSPPRP